MINAERKATLFWRPITRYKNPIINGDITSYVQLTCEHIGWKSKIVKNSRVGRKTLNKQTIVNLYYIDSGHTLKTRGGGGAGATHKPKIYRPPFWMQRSWLSLEKKIGEAPGSDAYVVCIWQIIRYHPRWNRLQTLHWYTRNICFKFVCRLS